jgi:hypothetical protein
MRLRARRRSLLARDPAGRYGTTGLTRLAPTRRIRRVFRIGALLTVIGLMRLARGVRPRWQPLLVGGVLTVVGIMLRNGTWSAVSLPGLWLLAYAMFIPGVPDAHQKRRAELERELAAYSTPAQRSDLAATLDRYPDGATCEVREILSSQAVAAGDNGIPGAGRC